MIYQIIGLILIGTLPAAFFGVLVLDSDYVLDWKLFISWMVGYFFFASVAGLGVYLISLA